MQLEKRSEEWESSTESPEIRMFRVILWPYRDTLARSHLMFDLDTIKSN